MHLLTILIVTVTVQEHISLSMKLSWLLICGLNQYMTTIMHLLIILKTDNYVHMHLAILCDKISRSNYVLLRTWHFFCNFLNFHLSFKEKEKQGRVKEFSMVQWINLSRYHISVVDSRLKSLIVTKIWCISAGFSVVLRCVFRWENFWNHRFSSQTLLSKLIFFLTWTCNCCVASLCSLAGTYTISPTSFWSRVCASSCSGTWAHTTSLRTTTPGWPLSPTTIHCDTIKYNMKNENQNYLIIKIFEFKKGQGNWLL